mmetsp:Transcript_9717/g.29626  ORF Transcript_9717/g.29626 Transcript_9717/m.29626 type:complete len:127 (+) Transcript_9717:216-596(+)
MHVYPSTRARPPTARCYMQEAEVVTITACEEARNASPTKGLRGRHGAWVADVGRGDGRAVVKVWAAAEVAQARRRSCKRTRGRGGREGSATLAPSQRPSRKPPCGVSFTAGESNQTNGFFSRWRHC